jgi:hypothetical protein
MKRFYCTKCNSHDIVQEYTVKTDLNETFDSDVVSQHKTECRIGTPEKGMRYCNNCLSEDITMKLRDTDPSFEVEVKFRSKVDLHDTNVGAITLGVNGRFYCADVMSTSDYGDKTLFFTAETDEVLFEERAPYDLLLDDLNEEDIKAEIFLEGEDNPLPEIEFMVLTVEADEKYYKINLTLEGSN